MSLDYAALLNQAWRIWRRHRVLWVFGLLMAFSEVPSAGQGFWMKAQGEGLQQLAQMAPALGQRLMSLQSALQARPYLALVLVAGILVVGVAFVVLWLLSFAALAEGTQQTLAGNEALRTGELWRMAWGRLGTLLFVSAGGVLVAMVVGGCSLPFLLVGAMVPLVGLLCVIAFFLVVGFLAQRWITAALLYGTLKRMRASEALGAGMRLLRDAFWPWVLIGLIGSALDGVIGGVAFLPNVALGILWFESMSRNLPTLFWGSLGIAVLYNVAVFIPLSGLTTSYLTVLDVLAFSRLQGNGLEAAPPLVRPVGGATDAEM